MELNNIMRADLLDILFEGKNKAYGAYDLRKTYNRRISLAMICMASVCLIFSLSRILANGKSNGRVKTPVIDITLNNIKEPKDLPKPPEVHPVKADPPRVQTIIFTPPAIVKDDLVDDLPPSVDQIDNSQIGLINQDGIKEADFVAPPVEQGTGVTEAPKTKSEDYEKPFIRVEKEAKFPGGMEGWKRYLERNLNASVAADDGAPTGNYTVKVQFIVDKEGGISNVQAIEVPGTCPSCGPEAVKVIKKGPNWEPAIQNDRKVIYQAVQYVTFQVAEE